MDCGRRDLLSPNSCSSSEIAPVSGNKEKLKTEQKVDFKMGTPSFSHMLSTVVQDAVYKLCTKHMTFSKQLEIDAIICLAADTQEQEVTIKMHRTVVKSKQDPELTYYNSPSIRGTYELDKDPRFNLSSEQMENMMKYYEFSNSGLLKNQYRNYDMSVLNTTEEDKTSNVKTTIQETTDEGTISKDKQLDDQNQSESIRVSSSINPSDSDQNIYKELQHKTKPKRDHTGPSAIEQLTAERCLYSANDESQRAKNSVWSKSGTWDKAKSPDVSIWNKTGGDVPPVDEVTHHEEEDVHDEELNETMREPLPRLEHKHSQENESSKAGGHHHLKRSYPYPPTTSSTNFQFSDAPFSKTSRPSSLPDHLADSSNVKAALSSFIYHRNDDTNSLGGVAMMPNVNETTVPEAPMQDFNDIPTTKAPYVKDEPQDVQHVDEETVIDQTTGERTEETNYSEYMKALAAFEQSKLEVLKNFTDVDGVLSAGSGMPPHTTEQWQIPPALPHMVNANKRSPNTNSQSTSENTQGEGGSNFMCYMCPEPRPFRSLFGFKCHQKRHTGTLPYSCKYCSKSFHGKTHLENHIRIHTGDKPYQCTLCKKAFTEKGNLKQHMTKHAMKSDTVNKQ
ncbi:unnamed protein product [Owenia fusiformis]|uniref:Uncharacterized protein n=1 Tax=Owenia fusiformis TaxID=6347 RepID=A0A8J1ULZ9_OWEFU|nr:unnamed protein product [Owenia fusiformis]